MAPVKAARTARLRDIEEPSGSGRNLLIGGCGLSLLVLGGLVSTVERVREHEDTLAPERGAMTAEAEAQKPHKFKPTHLIEAARSTA